MSNPYKCSRKALNNCTKEELEQELLYWEWEIKNATRWGAALGAAFDFLIEIKRRLRRYE